MVIISYCRKSNFEWLTWFCVFEHPSYLKLPFPVKSPDIIPINRKTQTAKRKLERWQEQLQFFMTIVTQNAPGHFHLRQRCLLQCKSLMCCLSPVHSPVIKHSCPNQQRTHRTKCSCDESYSSHLNYSNQFAVRLTAVAVTVTPPSSTVWLQLGAAHEIYTFHKYS